MYFLIIRKNESFFNLSNQLSFFYEFFMSLAIFATCLCILFVILISDLRHPELREATEFVVICYNGHWQWILPKCELFSRKCSGSASGVTSAPARGLIVRTGSALQTSWFSPTELQCDNARFFRLAFTFILWFTIFLVHIWFTLRIYKS